MTIWRLIINHPLYNTNKKQLEYKPQEALQYLPQQQQQQQQQVLQYSQQLQQALQQQQLQPAALQHKQSKMKLGYNPQQASTYNQGSHH